mgnify:CR=1 FL=1
MKYFIFQGNNHDCGFASLKMLLASISHDKSYLYIPKVTKREYFTVDELANIANDYGVELGQFACDDDYFTKMQCPCITLIDSNHAVLVKKVTKRNITFYDPYNGRVKLKRENFLKRWKLKVKDNGTTMPISCN